MWLGCTAGDRDRAEDATCRRILGADAGPRTATRPPTISAFGKNLRESAEFRAAFSENCNSAKIFGVVEEPAVAVAGLALS